jgi:hypothetical protein
MALLEYYTTKMTPEKGKCDNFVAYSLLGASRQAEELLWVKFI